MKTAPVALTAAGQSRPGDGASGAVPGKGWTPGGAIKPRVWQVPLAKQ